MLGRCDAASIPIRAEPFDLAQVRLEKLARLICQAKTQLEEFDSSVAESMTRMRHIVSGDAAMKQALGNGAIYRQI